MWPGESCDHRRWPTEANDHFIAWKLEGEGLVKIYPIQTPRRTAAPVPPLSLVDTPFDRVATSNLQLTFDSSSLSEIEKKQVLVIECAVCDLIKHVIFLESPEDELLVQVSLNNVACYMGGGTNRRVWQRQTETMSSNETRLSTCFALTPSEKNTDSDVIYHRFLELVVDEAAGKAWSVDSTLLLVPAEHPEALHHVLV